MEKVNLGHTRLSIIDITGGNQPITNQAGVAVVVNGELYDFERMKCYAERFAYQKQFVHMHEPTPHHHVRVSSHAND